MIWAWKLTGEQRDGLTSRQFVRCGLLRLQPGCGAHLIFADPWSKGWGQPHGTVSSKPSCIFTTCSTFRMSACVNLPARSVD